MKRIEWVDFGKGFTILFVVLSHVLDGLHKTAGLESYENVTKILMAVIFTFIMPVFFCFVGICLSSHTKDQQIF